MAWVGDRRPAENIESVIKRSHAQNHSFLQGQATGFMRTGFMERPYSTGAIRQATADSLLRAVAYGGRR